MLKWVENWLLWENRFCWLSKRQSKTDPRRHSLFSPHFPSVSFFLFPFLSPSPPPTSLLSFFFVFLTLSPSFSLPTVHTGFLFFPSHFPTPLLISLLHPFLVLRVFSYSSPIFLLFPCFLSTSLPLLSLFVFLLHSPLSSSYPLLFSSPFISLRIPSPHHSSHPFLVFFPSLFPPPVSLLIPLSFLVIFTSLCSPLIPFPLPSFVFFLLFPLLSYPPP